VLASYLAGYLAILQHVFPVCSATSSRARVLIRYYYYIPVICVTTFVTIASGKEQRNPIPQARLPPVECGDIMKCFFVSPTLHKDFFIVTMSRTMYYCGISTMAFLQYFFRDLVICAPPYGSDCVEDLHGHGRIQDYMAKTALIAVYAQAGSAVSAYPSGLASDAWGRKPLVYMACLGMGAIYLFMPFFSGEELVMILGFVWGVCNGCFVAVDFAIAIDTLPDKQEAAKFLGVWGVSAFVGTTLGPITGGLALYFLGQIEDGLGGGGHMAEGESLMTYRYSKYGYIGVMALGAMWNVLSCIIISWVDFGRAAKLQKKNADARSAGVQ
jgi:MFS family permease